MVLQERGEYCYGTGPGDMWEYCVRRNKRVGMIPVTHWKQAVCACGHTGFEVEFLFEHGPDEPDHDPTSPYLATRYCVKCGGDHTFLKSEGTEELGRIYYQEGVCLCDGKEFEVVGVTAPFGVDCPDTADWFYLMLRCVRCGCLGLYAYWQERYNDFRELLALL